MSTENVIDVREIEPRHRHPMIFDRLDALAPGESLRLVNDHEPKPLLYQLDAERPEQFRWETAEAGPEVWAVDITARARVVDARPVIARGEEPRAMIMSAADELRDGEVLVVYAPFDPAPLKVVFEKRGFTHRTDQVGPADWRVTFIPG